LRAARPEAPGGSPAAGEPSSIGAAHRCVGVHLPAFAPDGRPHLRSAQSRPQLLEVKVENILGDPEPAEGRQPGPDSAEYPAQLAHDLDVDQPIVVLQHHRGLLRGRQPGLELDPVRFRPAGR